LPSIPSLSGLPLRGENGGEIRPDGVGFFSRGLLKRHFFLVRAFESAGSGVSETLDAVEDGVGDMVGTK